MDYKYIEQLLDRYFQAETTQQEEQILRTFFAQSDDGLPAQLAQYAPLFTVLSEREQPSDALTRRLLALADAQEAPQQQAAVQPLRVRARTVSLAQRLRPLFGAAAVVAILLTLAGAISQSFRAADTWVDADEYASRQAPQPAALEPAVAYEQLADTIGRPSADGSAVRPAAEQEPAGR